MRPILLLSVLALVLGSAAAAGAQETPCEQGPVEAAESYDPARPESLSGSFRLVRVGTSWPVSAPSLADTAVLELHLATPEEKAEALREGIGRTPRSVTHVGTHRWSLESRPPRPVETEGDQPVIHVGCRFCFDAAPWVLYVAAVSEDGFWGLWRDYQTGTGRVFDDAGRRLPDPAGYFCAQRIDGS